ncbi:MAG TPA: hypothetical protein VIF82_09465 [Burkholderiaceae bacterium]|jgi:hypothetical protein
MSDASAASSDFSFGVIAYPFRTSADESSLRAAIKASDADNLAFVVVSGIKSNAEPCSDNIYTKHRALLDSAQNGLVLSLTANDWSDCKKSSGRSAAVERLNRIRELFFADEFSFGASKIPLLRQSASPRFRSYGENARWEINNIMFATINLPANNNNYLAAAGRNSEFEDRMIANREWLQRLIVYASLKKLHGVVLFCDGNPMSVSADQNTKRDGFLEIRRQLIASAAKFSGKILIVHNQSNTTQPATINWHRNVGEFGATSGWIKVTVTPSNTALFSISDNPIEVKTARQ